MAGRALVREYNALVAERILDVAARLFVEHGVAAVGMAGVAKAAEQFRRPRRPGAARHAPKGAMSENPRLSP